MTDSVALKCGTFCQEYVVLQDRWSLMAVVSQDRFHCIMVASAIRVTNTKHTNSDVRELAVHGLTLLLDHHSQMSVALGKDWD